MTLWVLYVLLVKATTTSFTGLASLPVVRQELVANNHCVSDVQLNTALALSQVTPGPLGLYIVPVGYYAAGWPGALVAWIALSTPAFIAVPLVIVIGKMGSNPRVAAAVRAAMVASAGLLLGALFPMARGALTDPLTIVIAAATTVVLIRNTAPVFLVIVFAGVTTYIWSHVH